MPRNRLSDTVPTLLAMAVWTVTIGCGSPPTIEAATPPVSAWVLANHENTQARDALREGDYPSGRTHALECLRLVPEHIGGRLNLGWSYVYEGHYERAVETLQPVGTQCPAVEGSSGPLVALCFYEMGERERALAELIRVRGQRPIVTPYPLGVRNDREYRDFWIGRLGRDATDAVAFMFLMEGCLRSPEIGRDLLDRFESGIARRSLVHYYRAQLTVEEGDKIAELRMAAEDPALSIASIQLAGLLDCPVRERLRAAERAAAVKPTRDAYMVVALARYELGDVADAWSNLRRALGVAPHFTYPPSRYGRTPDHGTDSFARYLQAGLVWNDLDDNARAAELLSAAVPEDPKNAILLALLGAHLRVAGDSEEALPILERAVSLDDDLLIARFHLAMAYWSHGRFSEAEAHLSRVIDAYPDYPDYFAQRALVRGSLKDLAGAVADYGRAIDLSVCAGFWDLKRRGELFAKRARLLGSAGEHDLAAIDWSYALGSDEAPEWLLECAEQSRLAGNTGKATTYFVLAMRSQRSDGQIRHRATDALRSMGEIEICRTCGGTGGFDVVVPCHMCDGNGTLARVDQGQLGYSGLMNECSWCQGSGRGERWEACDVCLGYGELLRESR